MKRRIAFTLSEVLLTMMLIGTIATLTIAPMITSYKEKANIVKLKKFYTEFNNALQMAKAVEGPIEKWGWIADNNEQGALNVLEKIVPYLQIAKNCGTRDMSCAGNTAMNTTIGNVYFWLGSPSWAQILLSNGNLVIYRTNCSDCNCQKGTSRELKKACGILYVDIDGTNNSHTFGKDTFGFWITKYGIIPFGTREDTGAPFSSDIKTSSGESTTAWIIEKGNMDYLRGEVSWD